MKILIAAITLLCCIYNCTAQTDSTKRQVDTTVIQVDTAAIIDTTGSDGFDDKTFTQVEIQSIFPGGLPAWKDFLQRNLRYPQKAIDRRIEGTVIVQFIVCKDGSICDIEAISGPGELRETAVNVLKKTPNWVPALQNGKVVRSYKKQPIIFRLGRK
jgi:periplasmic protein TonB